MEDMGLVFLGDLPGLAVRRVSFFWVTDPVRRLERVSFFWVTDPVSVVSFSWVTSPVSG